MVITELVAGGGGSGGGGALVRIILKHVPTILSTPLTHMRTAKYRERVSI